MNFPDFLGQDEYGYIHLAGHRIGLRHVVELYNEAYTPEMILDHFPTLTLALIYKTIGFYLDNQAEVDNYVAECRKEIERLEAAPVMGPTTPNCADAWKPCAGRRTLEQCTYATYWMNTCAGHYGVPFGGTTVVGSSPSM